MTEHTRYTSLGELCKPDRGGLIQTGPFGSQLHASDYTVAGTPVVMPANIADNRIDTSGIARVGDDHTNRLSRHRLRPGDVVYSRRGDITRRALVREEEAGWLCGTGCLLVRPGADVDPRWLSFWLGAPWTHEYLLQRAVGATMANLNTGILSGLPVGLPPLEEQRRIAGVLGALDDLATVEFEQAERSAQLAQALVARTEVRVPLGDVALEHRATCTPEGLTNHFSLPAFDAGVLPERVQGSGIKSLKNQLRAPCVLISRLNPHIPRVWMAYPDEAVNSVASTEFVVVEPDGAEAEWLWAATSGREFVAQMQGRVTGTTGSHQRVDKAALMQLTIPSPAGVPESDRHAVVTLVREAAAARREAARLRRTRDELLPLLLSGRVRVGEVAA